MNISSDGDTDQKMADIEIFDIRWHRAILQLCFHSDEMQQLYLYRVNEKTFIPFVMENVGDYKTATLNLMTAMGREPLSKGRWIIACRFEDALLQDPDSLLEEAPYLRHRMERDVLRMHKNEKLSPQLLETYIRQEGLAKLVEHPYDTHDIRWAQEILAEPDDYSRLFRYAKSKYGYAAFFTARETSENVLVIDLNIDFYVRNGNPRVRKRSRRFLEKQVFGAAYRVIRFFTRRGSRRILFFKQNGEHPTDNMAALQARMFERSMERDYHITCRCRNIFEGRQSITAWLKDLIAIARSDYIFIDDYTPIFGFIELDADVVLTQLWHAGVGFKSVGYARFGQPGSPDPYMSSHRHYTYALVGNAALREIYAEVFGIEQEALLATGMPRLDHFLDEETGREARETLYARYPALQNGRVIVFAPTFRGTGQKSAYYPYEYLDHDALYELCKETNSYFIYEMHHFIARRPEIAPAYMDRILDLSDENLSDLYHIADVLITDYSSCFYDFLLLKQPVILYVPDKMAYISRHGVQRPIDTLAPGEVCETFAQLTDTLRTGHYQKVEPKALTIDRAAERSGLASDRVIDTILLGEEIPGVRLKPMHTESNNSNV